jgi:hypothetical protein
VDGPGRTIADQILAYLLEHPQAQDTLAGITEWWLLEQRIRRAVSDVDTALQDLVAKDLILTRQCADGRTYYGLNQAKEREIRQHLRNAQTTEETGRDAKESGI